MGDRELGRKERKIQAGLRATWKRGERKTGQGGKGSKGVYVSGRPKGRQYKEVAVERLRAWLPGCEDVDKYNNPKITYTSEIIKVSVILKKKTNMVCSQK